MNQENKVCQAFESNIMGSYYGIPTNTYRYACLGLGILSILYYLVGFILVMINRKKSLRLQSRSLFLTICCTIGFMNFTTIVFLREYIGREYIPCWYYTASYYFQSIFGIGGIIGYFYLFIYKLRKQREGGYEIAQAFRVQRNRLMKSNSPGTKFSISVSGKTVNTSTSSVVTTLTTAQNSTILPTGDDKASSQRGKIDDNSTKDVRSLRLGSLSMDEVELPEQSFVTFIMEFFNVLKFSKEGKIVARKQKDSELMTMVSSSSAPSPSASMTSISQFDENDIEANGRSETSFSIPNMQAFQYLNESDEKVYTVSIGQRFLEVVVMPILLIVVFGLPMIVGFIVRILTEPLYRNGCKGCSLGIDDYIISTACSIFSFAVLSMAVFSMRNESDPFGIITEAKYVSFCIIPILIGDILVFVNPGNLDRKYIFSWDIIFALSVAVIYFFITYVHVYRAVIDRKLAAKPRRTNIEVPVGISTHGAQVNQAQANKVIAINSQYSATNLPLAAVINIDYLLGEPRARNALLEHCIDELSSENLVFVFKVRSWRGNWEKDTEEKVNRVAINIYQEYLGINAKSPINIPNWAWNHVQKSMSQFLIEQRGNLPDPSLYRLEFSVHGRKAPAMTQQFPNKGKSKKIPITVFDDCERECVAIIQTDILPRFIKSKLFVERILDTGIVNKIVVQ